MLKRRIRELFKSYDPLLQQVVQEVGELEQRYLSMQRPRGIYDEIDEILTRIAEREVEKSTTQAE